MKTWWWEQKYLPNEDKRPVGMSQWPATPDARKIARMTDEEIDKLLAEDD